MSDKLKAVLDKINKTYGVGSVSMLGDAPTIQVEAFSTGSLGLDICTGVGGFPRGRITEIYKRERKAQPISFAVGGMKATQYKVNNYFK